MVELTLATGECIGCHRDVTKPPSAFKLWSGYCKACNSDKLRVGLILATGYCTDCGVDVLKPPSQFKRWSGICTICARVRRRGIAMPRDGIEKMRQTKAGKYGGRNHWNWQGGITPKNEADRGRFKRTIQPLVFQRDDYTCQICYQRGGILHADHIQRWSEYASLRFDVDNCRTLCMACHYFVTFKRKLPEGIVWAGGRNRRIA